MATPIKDARAGRAAGPDAISLLINENHTLCRLFDRYRQSDSDDEKTLIAERACLLLMIRAAVEQEIFYPAAQWVLEDSEMIEDAVLVHEVTRDLITQLQEDDLRLDQRDALFEVLSECVDQQITDEESGLFKRMRQTGLSLDDLALQMLSRKAALELEFGFAEERDQESTVAASVQAH